MCIRVSNGKNYTDSVKDCKTDNSIQLHVQKGSDMPGLSRFMGSYTWLDMTSSNSSWKYSDSSAVPADVTTNLNIAKFGGTCACISQDCPNGCTTNCTT